MKKFLLFIKQFICVHNYTTHSYSRWPAGMAEQVATAHREKRNVTISAETYRIRKCCSKCLKVKYDRRFSSHKDTLSFYFSIDSM